MIDLSQNGVSHERVLRALRFEGGRRAVRYELHTLRGGVRHRRLRLYEKELRCEYLNDVKYTGSFTVEDDPLVDWRGDLIEFGMAVRVEDRTLYYPFPRLKPTRVRGNGRIRVEAGDETALLRGTSLGERLLIPAGTLYTQFIESSLAAQGFHGVLLEPCAAALSCDREDWEAGTSWLRLLNDLLAEIGYGTLEAGRDGLLRAGMYRAPDRSECRVRYAAGADSVILSGSAREIDGFLRPNRFIGYVSNPDAPPMWLEYINEDPASPTSPQRNGGYVLTAVRRFQHAADRESLEINVRRWAQESEQQYETVTLQTAVMPHHEAREMVAVECAGVSGVYTEIGWTIGEVMTHRLRRISYE